MKHSFYVVCILAFLNFSGCMQGASVIEREERREINMAITDALYYFRFSKSLKDFGERFRRLINLSPLTVWQNKETLLNKLLKLIFPNVWAKSASLCEAELSLKVPDENYALEFIHPNVRLLNDENIDIKNFTKSIKEASEREPHSIRSTIMSNFDKLFAQSDNQSQYVVYAIIYALIDTMDSIDNTKQVQYLADLEIILANLRDLKVNGSFINDSLMQQWITKKISQIKSMRLFLVYVRSNLQPLLYKESQPEQIYFKLMRGLKEFEWDGDWTTIAPVIEELLKSKNYENNLMIIFAIESAKKQEIIKGLGDNWIDKQIQEIPPIRQSIETVESICHVTETIDKDTDEMLSCMPLLRSKLILVLQEKGLMIPFIYGFIKDILSSSKLSLQLKAFCLGTIGDYYSERHLWDQLQFKELGGANPAIVNFGHWIKEHIDQIDPVTWLEKVRPSVFDNLPIRLLDFKDVVRSLFTISSLQHGFDKIAKEKEGEKYYAMRQEFINAIQAAVFKSMRIIAIARSIGFKYRLFQSGLSDIRTMPAFDDVQPYFYLDDPDLKDPSWNTQLSNAVELSDPPVIYVDLMKQVISHYKIHLMPKEDEAEKCLVDLMHEIKNDKDLRDKIIIFKILCYPDQIIKFDRAPRIVIYVSGQSNAQDVLNKLFKLFGPEGRYRFVSAGRAPAYNQRVTDLIFFAQGDRNTKFKSEYNQFFELPDKIYYVPTILQDGEKHNFKLDNPAE